MVGVVKKLPNTGETSGLSISKWLLFTKIKTMKELFLVEKST